MQYTFNTSTVTVLQAKLIGEIIEGTTPVLSQWHWDAQSQSLFLDFDGTLSAQEEIDVQTLLDNHDPIDYIAMDAEAAETRFQNAKQDFRALIDILGPAYDSLTPTQRANLIANYGNLQGLTDVQFRNTIGLGLALYGIGLDYLERRERGD